MDTLWDTGNHQRSKMIEHDHAGFAMNLTNAMNSIHQRTSWETVGDHRKSIYKLKVFWETNDAVDDYKILHAPVDRWFIPLFTVS